MASKVVVASSISSLEKPSPFSPKLHPGSSALLFLLPGCHSMILNCCSSRLRALGGGNHVRVYRVRNYWDKYRFLISVTGWCLRTGTGLGGGGGGGGGGVSLPVLWVVFLSFLVPSVILVLASTWCKMYSQHPLVIDSLGLAFLEHNVLCCPDSALGGGGGGLSSSWCCYFICLTKELL